MKYIFIALFCLPMALMAQNEWTFPKNAISGKTYVQCLIFSPDTLIDNIKCRYPIPPIEWEGARFMVQESYQLKTIIKLPVFDTILLKIPVDKTTHLANIPDLYDVREAFILLSPASEKWILMKKTSIRFLGLDTINCMVWGKAEMGHYGKYIPTLTLKSMAHQLRIDSSNLLIIKQIVEKSPIEIKEETVPPEFKTIVVRKAQHRFWSGFREIIICSSADTTQIIRIQESLKRLHYYRGRINNKLNRRTKKALIKYQKDKGLPIGNLNYETIKSLGAEEQF
jgi:Putative peptidoglycan binding domain